MGYDLERFLGAPPKEFLEVWLLPKKFVAQAFKRRMSAEQFAHNKKISGTDLKKTLGWVSLTCFGVGSIIATGIFSFMPEIYAKTTGPAVILSLLVAAVTAATTALLYSEFAVEYPVVGGGFVYVLNTFGEFPAVLCATNLVVDYVFGTSAVVRNFSLYFSELIGRNHDIFLINDVDTRLYNMDYIALCICIFLTLVAILSTRAFDEGNILLQLLHIGLVCFTFIAAFTQANASYWSPFFPSDLPDHGPHTIVTGASNIFFVFIGYDVIALGAEEAKSEYSVPIAMFVAVILVTIVYVLMAASLIMLVPYSVLAAQPANVKIAGFAYGFQLRGMKWAKYIVSLGACVGIFTSTGIGIYGLSRVVTVFSREGLVPAFVGHVNPFTYTPVVAIAIAGFAAGVMAFFTGFSTLANMTSIGTLCMFWFVAISYLYRRYAPEFEEDHGDRHFDVPFRPDVFGSLSVLYRRVIVLGFITLITLAPVGFTIYWNLGGGGYWALVMTVCLWVAVTFAFQLTCPICFVPRKFALPWWSLPWVPSTAVWCTLMLVGGFGASTADYVRLFIAMGIGIVIYITFGVHSTYYRFHRAPTDYIEGEYETEKPLQV